MITIARKSPPKPYSLVIRAGIEEVEEAQLVANLTNSSLYEIATMLMRYALNQVKIVDENGKEIPLNRVPRNRLSVSFEKVKEGKQ